MRRMPRVAKVPLNYDTIRSLTNAFKDVALGREAPSILREERERICRSCPFGGKKKRCTQCGCFIKTKVALLSSECPMGKWPSSCNATVHSTQENHGAE